MINPHAATTLNLTPSGTLSAPYPHIDPDPDPSPNPNHERGYHCSPFEVNLSHIPSHLHTTCCAKTDCDHLSATICPPTGQTYLQSCRSRVSIDGSGPGSGSGSRRVRIKGRTGSATTKMCSRDAFRQCSKLPTAMMMPSRTATASAVASPVADTVRNLGLQ